MIMERATTYLDNPKLLKEKLPKKLWLIFYHISKAWKQADSIQYHELRMSLERRAGEIIENYCDA